MIPKQAIEKAIEGGWKERFDYSHWSNSNNQTKIWHWEQIALDPAFWQALGKSCGWEAYTHQQLPDGEVDTVATWKFRAQEFYDLILNGESTDKFWNEILSII